jgi:membrane protease YdiL (CAAX protease family)
MNKQSIKFGFFKLHPILEFVLILIIALGDFIISAFKWVSISANENTVITYGNSDILHLLFYETGVLLVIVFILKWQRWPFKNFGLSFSIDKITAGLVLFIANYFIYLLMFKLFGSFVLTEDGGSTSATVSFSTSLNILPLTLFSLFNPFFEEFILVGYIVTSLRKKFGLVVCVIVSVFFRLSFHIYQGPIILLSILPMGVLFAIYFWNKKSILPLIIGHGLMDFLSIFVLMTLNGQ